MLEEAIQDEIVLDKATYAGRGHPAMPKTAPPIVIFANYFLQKIKKHDFMTPSGPCLIG